MIFCYLIFSFTIYSSTSFDISLRENIGFDFLCTENGFYWSRCYFTMNVFIYWWHHMTFPHWKMILLDAFIIWCSLSKLVNTSLYFFPSFSKTGLFNLSILYANANELMKLLTVSNINTLLYHHSDYLQGIFILIIAIFNWV